MKKRRYSAGGGVPVSGGSYDAAPVQYPFPPQGGESAPSSNTTVNVNGEETESNKAAGPFAFSNKNPADAQKMRRGGKVKSKNVRGDGIAIRGKTRGRFV